MFLYKFSKDFVVLIVDFEFYCIASIPPKLISSIMLILLNSWTWILLEYYRYTTEETWFDAKCYVLESNKLEKGWVWFCMAISENWGGFGASYLDLSNRIQVFKLYWNLNFVINRLWIFWLKKMESKHYCNCHFSFSC